MTFEKMRRVQRAHVAKLHQKPNDYYFGARSFLDRVNDYYGDLRYNIEGLFNALTYHAASDCIFHSEDGMWSSKSIAPEIVQHIKERAA